MAAGMLIFGGCQSQPQEQPFFNDDVPMDRRIGLIKSLGGVRTESQGTHILQLDNGDTVLLKSTPINLDDSKYAGQTVEVRGVITYTKDSRSLMEVMNIDILEQYEAQEAAKAKWVTFSDSTLEISIIYRNDFNVKESASGVTFEIPEKKSPQNSETAAAADSEEAGEEDTAAVQAEEGDVFHLITIEVKTKSADENLVSMLDLEGETGEDLLKAGLTMSKVGMDRLTAYKSDTMDGAGLTFYVESGSKIYTISFEAGTDSGYVEAQNLFYEMLGTFKITDEMENADTEEIDDNNNNESDVTGSNDDGEVPADEASEDGDEAVADEENAVEDEETDDDTEVADGFNVFENETFEFSIQYPKNWYYSGSATNESDVIRRYEFGDEPTDEKSGNVYLDIISGDIPSGSTAGADGTITVVNSDGTVEYYIEGESRNFRLSGPSSIQSTLLEMAETLE